MKNNDYLISIIVPLFNCESTINRCVDSLVAQDYKNIEILLIDDGSTDGSLEICNNYANKYQNVFVYHINNSGVSMARNVGVEHAKGDYISFVDADDQIESMFISKLLRICLENNADIAYCNYYRITNTKKYKNYNCPSGIVEKHDAVDAYSAYYHPSIWGKLFKKELIKDFRFLTDMYYGEDTIFYINTALQSNTIYYLEEPLYLYLINPNGAMESYDLEKRKSQLLSKIIIQQTLEKQPDIFSVAYKNASSEVFNTAAFLKRAYYKNKWKDKSFLRTLTNECKKNRKFFIHNKHFSFLTRVSKLIISTNFNSWLFSKII